MSVQPEHLSEADLIRAWLAHRDVECPVCGYNLRSAPARCPECGAHLELRLGSSDLRLGPWIVALLGLALPLGFVGIFSIIWLLPVLVSGQMGAARSFLLLPASMIGIYVGTLALLIRRRRKFWSRAPRVQWLIAILLLLASLAVLFGGPLLLVFVLDASGVI